MAGPKTFVDTNVLVYAYDSAAGDKRQAAKSVLAELWRTGDGLVSTQVLQELYVTLTRKVPRPLDASLAREIVADMLAWDVVVNDGDSLLRAFDIERRERLSFWDALIVAAAERGGAVALLSEDLPHGRILAGVRVRNPFLPAP
jgi:predicted nucleic acid-binding protein